MHNGEGGVIMTGTELRQLRKSAGMTQADLAGQLDTWQSVISEMEHDVRPITRRTELAVRYVCQEPKPS